MTKKIYNVGDWDLDCSWEDKVRVSCEDYIIDIPLIWLMTMEEDEESDYGDFVLRISKEDAHEILRTHQENWAEDEEYSV
jgi:hypothetical protein